MRDGARERNVVADVRVCLKSKCVERRILNLKQGENLAKAWTEGLTLLAALSPKFTTSAGITVSARLAVAVAALGL